MNIEPGVYRHYKGKTYQVIGTALHTETSERVVVYRALYNDPKLGPNPLFVRPADMFAETVEVNGGIVPRFTKL